jgi:predicted methyltransferase
VTIRAYHRFEHPEQTLASIHRALRPEGRFVVIDPERIRGVTDSKRFGHVRAGKGTVTDEIVDAGFILSKEIPLLPNGLYFLVFEKR